MIVAGKEFFSTEGECRNEAVKWIGRVHGAGMLAPARFQCVPWIVGILPRDDHTSLAPVVLPSSRPSSKLAFHTASASLS